MNEEWVKRWMGRRKTGWDRLDGLARKDGRLTLGEASELIRLYQLAQGDLALARQELLGTPFVQQLQALLMRANREISRPAHSVREDIGNLVAKTVPEYVGEVRFKLLGLFACFGAFAVAGATLVLSFPELSGLFLSQKMIHEVQAGRLWTESMIGIVPASVLSLGIMTNNIIVVLGSFTLGLFYGLGTLYIVGMNGLMLGGAFAFTIRYGMADRLLAFILPHGFVEISVILVVATCGFAMGEAIARPGRLTRQQSLQRAAGKGFSVCLFCLPFLVGAGIIEGYVSPSADFSIAARLAIGLAYESVFVACITGWLFRRRGFAT